MNVEMVKPRPQFWASRIMISAARREVCVDNESHPAGPAGLWSCPEGRQAGGGSE
jgi:hypothetical protein